MKFEPRDEYEREAFSIEPPEFNIGDSTKLGVVTDIYLRTVDWPLWLYQIDGSEEWYDRSDL